VRIASQKDFAAGLMYMAAGLGFAIIASTYRMGTAARMGPGYFPFWLGVLLAVVGAVVLFRSMRSEEVDKVTRWELRSLVVVLASVVVFGLLLMPMGLMVSVVALVVGSSLASDEFSWKATLITTIALLAISLVVFVYGLSLQFPVWPEFIGG
jgi:hypothetical protein